jgi:hypothetical protein
MMTESTTSQPSASPAATAFELHIHFQGAFIFSVTTEGNSSHPNAKLTGVEVFTPACEHTNAATINTGSTYMLESYWHCIDPVYAASHSPAPLTLSQMQKNIGANTPWAASNRPMGAAWDIAYKLPIAPDDWQCGMLASTVGPSTGSCFSGNDANIIPEVVALEQTLIYKQVSSVKFHGACFAADFTPVNGVTDLYLTSEVPYIPTRQHERRAADAMAGLLGLDLVLDYSIGSTTQAAGVFQPKLKAGNCLMSIVSGPKAS